MLRYSLALSIIGLALEATLILRGMRGGLLRRFPLFYSYVVYYFSASLVTFLIYRLRPEFYATSYWFCYLITLVAEFAVLLEISEHIFAPYPVIRMLGRLIGVVICSLFFVFYVLPSFLKAQSSSAVLLDFSLRTSLTKAVIIAVLGVIARYYRLQVGRNVAGLMAGFGLYLGVYMANFAAAQSFGRTLYADILRFIGPLGSILCLAVWTVAMWQPQSVPLTGHELSAGRHRSSEELNYKLVRFNSTLTKLLRK